MNSNRQIAESGDVSHLELAREALVRYALEVATLTLISESNNALYKVSVPSEGGAIYHPYLGRISGQQLLLRIENCSENRVATTYSELTLLATLLRDTDLALPEPVPTASGELVPELWLDGMVRPQQCILFRWASISFPEQSLQRAVQWHTN